MCSFSFLAGVTAQSLTVFTGYYLINHHIGVGVLNLMLLLCWQGHFKSGVTCCRQGYGFLNLSAVQDCQLFFNI